MQVKGLLVALLSGIITYAVGISLAVGHATLDRGTQVRILDPQPFNKAHSSSGLGHRPLKAKITGSNPVCATKH